MIASSVFAGVLIVFCYEKTGGTTASFVGNSAIVSESTACNTSSPAIAYRSHAMWYSECMSGSQGHSSSHIKTILQKTMGRLNEQY